MERLDTPANTSTTAKQSALSASIDKTRQALSDGGLHYPKDTTSFTGYMANSIKETLRSSGEQDLTPVQKKLRINLEKALLQIEGLAA